MFLCYHREPTKPLVDEESWGMIKCPPTMTNQIILTEIYDTGMLLSILGSNQQALAVGLLYAPPEE